MTQQVNQQANSSKEQLLEKLKNGLADVQLDLRSLPSRSPGNVDLATAARANAELVSSAISAGARADKEFTKLKELLRKDKPSLQEIQDNDAYQALCEFNPTFKSRAERLLKTEQLNFASSSRYGSGTPVYLTQGNNIHNYNWSTPIARSS